MSRASFALSVAAVLTVAGAAAAQPADAPRGPADVITGAREAREAPGAGHTAPDAERTAAEAHAARALAEPQVAFDEASEDVPAGEIRVTVVDAAGGGPASGARVRLGVLAQGGDRESKSAVTDANGEARFGDLPTGSGQAYRVSVLHEGATYGSAPFRLEPDRGHVVRILRIPVTRDDGAILQWIGGSFLEIKPDARLHVVQQVELVNLGNETYVFPPDGLQVALPEGFTAFQSQQVMTDQRFVPNERGFRLEGSLPPGRVQLMWGYDVPIDGEELTLSQRIPFRTYQYIVITDDVPGLELEVAGFPPAQRGDDRGRARLGTRMEWRPDEPPWERLRITLRGIPGPGPERWLAVVLALAFLGLGVYLARNPGEDAAEAAARREGRRAELLEEARELEAAFARAEVGPKYHERRRREIVDELAILLGMDRREAAGGAPAAGVERGKRRA